MSVLKAAGIIAVLSLVSKFVGLFREVVIANYFGTNFIRDAYGIAQLLPASFALVMLAGLNGPFHSSVVSVISKYKEQGRKDDIKIVITTLTILSCLFMGLISFLCIELAPYIIELIASKNAPIETRNLAIEQFKIMSPMFIISALIGISYGILNVEKVYFTPSLSPVMASLAIIVALFFSSKGDMSLALAWGTMIGSLLQLGLQLIPMLKFMKDYFGTKIQLNHEGIKQIVSILLPASLSSTVGQINLIIMTYFASSLPEGTISAINTSNFLFQLPLGIMLTALLVPMLPILSQTAAYNDNHIAFKKNINKSLRSVIFLSIPATVIFLCSGKQFIQLFERGAFNEHSTYITYRCLAALSISLVFYAIRDLMVRVFYAIDNAKIPFYTSVFSIITTTFACWLFVTQLKLSEAGITLSTSFVTVFNMSLLLIVLRKKIGKWMESETVSHITKVSLASIPVALYCIGFNYLVNFRFNIPIFILYSIFLGFIGIICIAILRALKDEETINITDKFIGKFKRMVKR
ncbi:MAG: murein biosynthesis integral membrane protein MurJ [Candidatus Sericytochromatia bacterium]